MRHLVALLGCCCCAVFSAIALGEVAPSFELDFAARHASDIVLIENGKVLESWKGGISPGLQLFPATEATPRPVRYGFSNRDDAGDPRLKQSGLKKVDKVTGRRIVQFLVRGTHVTDEMRQLLLDPAYRTVWIEAGQAFAIQPWHNPGPAEMRPLYLTETQLEQRVLQFNSTAEEPVDRESPCNPARTRSLSDDDLKTLPATIEVLYLRGQRAYGPDQITDEGLRHLARYPQLRTLHADGLGLTDASLETIAKLTALEALSLDSNRITGARLKRLVGLEHLRRLSLNFNQLVAEDFTILANLRGLSQLDVIPGSQHPYAVDDGVLQQCARLTNLETLRLSENTAAVTDAGLAHVSQLKQLKNFRLVGAKGVTDVGLAQLGQLSRLEDLALGDLRCTTPAGLGFLKNLTQLKRLALCVPADQSTIAAIGHLKKLESLQLWNRVAEPLSLERLSELHALREFRTNETLTSSDIRVLAGWENLESIEDGLTEIADDDLKQLARLPKLKVLILDSSQITAVSLPTLATMQSLRELYVTDAVRITPAQWTSLGHESLPQCRIQRFYAPYTVYHKPREQ